MTRDEMMKEIISMIEVSEALDHHHACILFKTIYEHINSLETLVEANVENADG